MAPSLLALFFRFFYYVCVGFFLEIVYSVFGVDRACGFELKRRVPKKYLEGFVSLYMIPIHGFGMLFLFEPVYQLIKTWPWALRFFIYAPLITIMEALGGQIYFKILGFYSWDYYRDSKYKIFKEGLTLWTLLPQWGIAGLLFELNSRLLVYLAPATEEFFRQLLVF